MLVESKYIDFNKHKKPVDMIKLIKVMISFFECLCRQRQDQDPHHCYFIATFN